MILTEMLGGDSTIEFIVSVFVLFLLIASFLVTGVFFKNRHSRAKWEKVLLRNRKGRRQLMRSIRFLPAWAIIAVSLLMVFAGIPAYETYLPELSSSGDVITCENPEIIDGDTFTCAGERIRLSSIDAPEMPGHCRAGRECTKGDPYAAQDYLSSLTRGEVICKRKDTDHYGRTVARCQSSGKDLSCEMIAAGYAVERYGYLFCL